MSAFSSPRAVCRQLLAHISTHHLLKSLVVVNVQLLDGLLSFLRDLVTNTQLNRSVAHLALVKLLGQTELLNDPLVS